MNLPTIPSIHILPMDFGPTWPFWAQIVVALAGVLLLARTAWRRAGAIRRWPAALLCAAILAGAAFLLLATDVSCGAGLPFPLDGCDWEFQRAQADPGALALFIVIGGVHKALRLGLPVMLLVFIVRWMQLRMRDRAARLASAR